MINDLLTKISEVLGFSQSGILRYFRNTAWLFSERFITMLIGVFVGIAVARYLKPYDYGVIQYGFTLYAIAVNFGSLGLDDLIMRDALKDPKQEGNILGTAFALRVAACLISFIGCAFFAFFTTDQSTMLPTIIITIGVLFHPLGIIAIYFQIKVQGKLKATAIMVGYSIAAAIKIVLIFIQAPLMYFAFAMVLDTIIAMLLFLIFYLHENSLKSWRFDRDTAKYFFKVGWPLIFIMIFGTIYTKIDILLVKNLLGNDDLGIYSAAVRLTEVWYFIPIAVTISLFPAIVNAKTHTEGRQEGEYISRVEKICGLLTFGSICLGIFVTLTSKYIVSILYKTDYLDAAPVLAVFIWCLLFVSFNVISLKWLMMENEILLSLYRTVAGVIVSFVVTYIFITIYGINGAAVGTLIGYAFFTYFIDLFSKKTRELFMIKTRSIFFPAIFLYKLIRK